MHIKEAHSQSMTFSPHNKDFQLVLTNYMDEYKPSLKELKYASSVRPVRPDLAPLVPISVKSSEGGALR